MPGFQEIQAGTGFDPAIPWQMIPVGGTRAIKLTGAPGMVVSLIRFGGGPSVAAAITESTPVTADPRQFQLTGKAAGASQLVVFDPSIQKQLLMLEIAVLDSQEVTVDQYVVTDTAGRHSKVINCARLQQLTSEMDRILSRQANISVRSVACRAIVVPEDWGEVVDKDFAFSEFPRLTQMLGAHFHMFFVWDYRRKDGIEAVATTKGSFCIARDLMDNPGRDLTHECGHFLGLIDERDTGAWNNLMFFESGNGEALSKAQILKMRARIRRGLPVDFPKLTTSSLPGGVRAATAGQKYP